MNIQEQNAFIPRHSNRFEQPLKRCNVPSPLNQASGQSRKRTTDSKNFTQHTFRSLKKKPIGQSIRPDTKGIFDVQESEV